MCKTGRFITNQYDGREYYVSCGHCPACLQEKAIRRKNRIDEELRQNLSCFFVTFSYKNEYIPFVLESEYRNYFKNPFSEVHVYRNVFQPRLVDTLDYQDFSFRGKNTLNSLSFPKLKYIRHYGYSQVFEYYDKVGVLWLSDFQKFFNRLNLYLYRAGYKGHLSYYYTGEYGEKYHRPHIHALIYFDKGCDEVVKRTIIKSWNYSDLSKPLRQKDGTYREPIEVAKNPARYVSSYLNKRQVIPSILSDAKPFKMFAHFSKGFGHLNPVYSLSSLLQKIESGTLEFDKGVYRKGVLTLSKSSIPKYIIDKYWPKFKGFRYLSSDEVIDLVRNPQSIFFNAKLRNVLTSSHYNIVVKSFSGIEIRRCYCEEDDYLKIYKKLVSLNRRIPAEFYERWLLAYGRVWQLRASDAIRHSYDDCRKPSDIFQHFFNIKDYYEGKVINYYLDDLMQYNYNPVVDPNQFYWYQLKDQNLTKQFSDDLQHHRIKSNFYETIQSY